MHPAFACNPVSLPLTHTPLLFPRSTRSWCTRTPRRRTWRRWRSSSAPRTRPTCRRAATAATRRGCTRRRACCSRTCPTTAAWPPRWCACASSSRPWTRRARPTAPRPGRRCAGAGGREVLVFTARGLRGSSPSVYAGGVAGPWPAPAFPAPALYASSQAHKPSHPRSQPSDRMPPGPPALSLPALWS